MKPLVQPAELAELIASDDHVMVLDVRWYLTDAERGRREYDAGHVPGSRFVPIEHDLSAPVADDGRGGRHPLPSADDLQAALRRAGIDDDSHVVVLDQGPSLGAGRAWWMLRDAGLERVQVLDGGFAAWQEYGGAITTDLPEVRPGTVTVRPGQLPSVDADGVRAHLDAGGRVVDVRAAERFRGEVEPMDAVAGHIPGALNLPATELQDHGRFRPADEVAEMLSGLQPGDVLSCGSGITAAQALLAAEHAGISGLRLYPGSWSDWISDPDRPVATGE
ncbi:sulfurtransferase [Aestuariimicrobium ganziense]|uniref:sulfurtransferase n=1 Tax=Aestuariimicrobium ganziense TaxID=2773677 RepID=UPI00194557B8|nr:sulfurtransferase [Aestuariimicrobium ganziense]